MIKWTGLGLGFSLGAGFIYLLATDEGFRLGVTIAGVALVSVALVLVIVVIVLRSQASALASMRYPTYNQNTKMPPVQFYQQGQLPTPQQGWPLVIEQGEVVDSGAGEVIG